MIVIGHLSALFPETLDRAAACAWLVFGAAWIAGAAWTSRAKKRISWRRSAVDGSLYLAAFVLLFTPPAWTGEWWRTPPALASLVFGGELAALAFAVWARVHLGKLWSGAITLREGHRIVTSGPYRLVRHPVYTGFIAAAWAFAFLLASPTAFLGAALLTGEMIWKARREERFLRLELGETDYAAYAARTPMLVPRL